MNNLFRKIKEASQRKRIRRGRKARLERQSLIARHFVSYFLHLPSIFLCSLYRSTFMAFMASWPWKSLGTYKYHLLAPLGCQLLYKNYYSRGSYDDNHDPLPLLQDWCFHILLLSCLRCCVYEVWHVLSRFNFVSQKRAIQEAGVEFEQVDREFDCDNYLILQALIAAIAQACTRGSCSSPANLPLWSWQGALLLMFLHAGPTELFYYVIHRVAHSSKHLYNNYHSLHHASTRPEPSTAGSGTFLHFLLLTLVMALPIAGVLMAGQASLGLLYGYVLGFDFVRNMIHSNVEVVPIWPFERFSFLKYIVITPSYHSLHHTLGQANYCLFMPLYDYLGGTLNKEAFKLHAELRKNGRQEVVPDSVFVPHGVDLTSALHLGMFGRTFSSVPRQGNRWYSQPFLPVVFVGVWLSWFWGKAYLIADYTFHGATQQTWCVPFVGFQYFLPNAFPKINASLEETILEADRKGVKVLTLGALNKNEAMNGGGALFVTKHKNLKVRVCHGNTLTTAVILHSLPEDVKEVFLTGSTSKIGKAIALYLCRKRVRVLMLTASQERFDAVVREAPKEGQQYLVRATKYQAGQNCKTWIIGKWAGYSAQKLAPPGTHFYQFTLPPILHIRRDCTYSDSAGIKLPAQDVRGLNACEHTMPRYVVHACHAGGLIHALEGWQHHEVGAVDVDQIDVVWAAAMKHGFTIA